MKIIYLLIIITLTLSACHSREEKVNKSTLLGNDYRLFQGTPLWELAKAAQDQNSEKIADIIKNTGLNIDYQEARFGKTVLMLTVINNDYTSSKILLQMGASPNKHDNYNGSSAIIKAAGNQDGDYLKLMLVHGGNPNDVETGIRRKGNTLRNTPLLAACTQSLSNVKLLVKAGANINYTNEFGTTPLNYSLMLEKFDIALYLLQNGADFGKPILIRKQIENNKYLPNKRVYIVDFLDEMKQKGIDGERINEISKFIKQH